MSRRPDVVVARQDPKLRVIAPITRIFFAKLRVIWKRIGQALEIVAIEKKTSQPASCGSAYWLNHDPTGMVEAGYGPVTTPAKRGRAAGAIRPGSRCP